jgi:hypothetical protein
VFFLAFLSLLSLLLHLAYISVLGKRLSRKTNNVVFFPFAFHISVQQPFQPLWSRLLLDDLEPSQESFALRFESLLMTLLPSSEEFYRSFLSSRYLSSSGCYPLDLSGLGDPVVSNATAGLAIRVTGTHKPLHHEKVEIPSEEVLYYAHIKRYVVVVHVEGRDVTEHAAEVGRNGEMYRTDKGREERR